MGPGSSQSRLHHDHCAYLGSGNPVDRTPRTIRSARKPAVHAGAARSGVHYCELQGNADGSRAPRSTCEDSRRHLQPGFRGHRGLHRRCGRLPAGAAASAECHRQLHQSGAAPSSKNSREAEPGLTFCPAPGNERRSYDLHSLKWRRVMSYIGGNNLGGLESWEEEYSQSVSQSLAQLSQKHRLIILLSVGLVTAIEISNRLSINVLLPDLQGNVAGTSDDVSWVVILYNLGFLCSLAISFWMVRVLGARRHLLFSIALYATGAFGCFCSEHSLRLLLISRVIMGCGGGAFLVRTVILIRLMLPGKASIFAVSCLYTELCCFEAVYPVAMGWISDTLRWNYAFLLDFPFLAIGTFLIWKYLPWGHLALRSEKSYVDVWGAGLLVAALGSMQIALSRGERDLWFQSPFIVCFLLVAVVCFAGFLWWDWRPENPAPVLHLRPVW